METVGVVGVGKIGMPISQNLIKSVPALWPVLVPK